jgi:hypothetical protein
MTLPVKNTKLDAAMADSIIVDHRVIAGLDPESPFRFHADPLPPTMACKSERLFVIIRLLWSAFLASPEETMSTLRARFAGAVLSVS